MCTSVNEVICHGIPDDRALRDGDIVNCDVTIYLDGVHGDTSATFLVGDVDDDGRRLVQVTLRVPVARHRRGPPGRTDLRDRSRDPGPRRGQRASRVVRTFVGHGVGDEFHTAPSVPHYFDRTPTRVIEPGVTFTIEPMINVGTWQVGRIWPDGWTAPTADGSRSAQFEHTLLVTADRRRSADAPPRRAAQPATAAALTSNATHVDRGNGRAGNVDRATGG